MTDKIALNLATRAASQAVDAALAVVAHLAEADAAGAPEPGPVGAASSLAPAWRQGRVKHARARCSLRA